MWLCFRQSTKARTETKSYKWSTKLLPAVNKTKVQAVVFCFDGMTFSRL